MSFSAIFFCSVDLLGKAEQGLFCHPFVLFFFVLIFFVVLCHSLKRTIRVLWREKVENLVEKLLSFSKRNAKVDSTDNFCGNSSHIIKMKENNISSLNNNSGFGFNAFFSRYYEFTTPFL